MMTSRAIRLLFWVLGVLMLAASGVAIVYAVMKPVDFPAGPSGGPEVLAVENEGQAMPTGLTLSRVAAIWQWDDHDSETISPGLSVFGPLNVRRNGNLQSPAPGQPRLMAVAVEPTRSYAVFLDENNQLQVRSVGQTISDARISRIEMTRVFLERNGRQIAIDLALKF